MEKKYQITLTVGDWSNDGHSKKEVITILSTHSVEQIEEAYKKSVEKTGVDFTKEVCADYGEYTIDKDVLNKLNKFIEIDSIIDLIDYIDQNDFAILYCEFIKVSLPEFEYEVESGTPNNINIGGYGLFE